MDLSLEQLNKMFEGDFSLTMEGGAEGLACVYLGARKAINVSRNYSESIFHIRAQNYS